MASTRFWWGLFVLSSLLVGAQSWKKYDDADEALGKIDGFDGLLTKCDFAVMDDSMTVGKFERYMNQEPVLFKGDYFTAQIAGDEYDKGKFLDAFGDEKLRPNTDYIYGPDRTNANGEYRSEHPRAITVKEYVQEFVEKNVPKTPHLSLNREKWGDYSKRFAYRGDRSNLFPKRKGLHKVFPEDWDPVFILGFPNVASPLFIYHGSAWYHSVHGRKLWIVYPYGYETNSTFAQTPREWLLEYLHRLPRQAIPKMCVQKPGEAVYIPKYANYMAVDLDETISIGQVQPHTELSDDESRPAYFNEQFEHVKENAKHSKEQKNFTQLDEDLFIGIQLCNQFLHKHPGFFQAAIDKADAYMKLASLELRRVQQEGMDERESRREVYLKEALRTWKQAQEINVFDPRPYFGESLVYFLLGEEHHEKSKAIWDDAKALEDKNKRNYERVIELKNQEIEKINAEIKFKNDMSVEAAGGGGGFGGEL